jgi:hypothetical protein
MPVVAVVMEWHGVALGPQALVAQVVAVLDLLVVQVVAEV